MSRKSWMALGGVGLLVAALAVWTYLVPHPEPQQVLGGKRYSVAGSTIGDLLAFDEARALLDRYLPGLTGIRQLAVAEPLSLQDVQPFYPTIITDERLAQLNAELVQLEPSGVVLYTAASTQVGVLLDDPEARAIVDRYLPGFSANEQIDQARGFTLKFIQKFDPAMVSDEVLIHIDQDFEALAKQRAGQS